MTVGRDEGEADFKVIERSPLTGVDLSSRPFSTVGVLDVFARCQSPIGLTGVVIDSRATMSPAAATGTSGRLLNSRDCGRRAQATGRCSCTLHPARISTAAR
jgi:hypothetical protein